MVTYIGLLHAAQDLYSGLNLSSISLIASLDLQVHTKLKEEKACRVSRHKDQAHLITLNLFPQASPPLAVADFTHIWMLALQLETSKVGHQLGILALLREEQL